MDFKRSNLDLLIVTPLFFGDASGAAVYYNLLTQHLIERGVDIGVVSDMMQGSFQGSYIPLFPARCGLNKNIARDYALYALQNWRYLALPRIINNYKSDSLLIHSSFYNMIGIFPAVLKHILKKRANRINILDVRDRLMPPSAVKHLDQYDRVIACSDNVAAFLIQSGLSADKLTSIPVLQEPIAVDQDESRRFVESLGIIPGRYIFYAGLVKEEKGVDLLLEAFVQQVRKALPDISLVISGLLKTTSAKMVHLLGEDGVKYIGNRNRREVLQLMSQSCLCVNLSPIEGFPRSCLEALALNRHVLLPPNIPEFMKYCPESVVTERTPEAVAQRMIQAIEAGSAAFYPIQKHYPESVLPLYAEALSLSF